MNGKPQHASIAAAIAIAFALLLTTTPALAHHSFAMFDVSRTIDVEGTVEDFRWTNPHVFIQLLVENDRGVEEEQTGARIPERTTSGRRGGAIRSATGRARRS